MIRRHSLLASLFLVLCLSGCLKTRSDLKKDTENPDSGYDTKVVAAQNEESQRVTEELRGEINRLNGRIDDLQKKNDTLTKDSEKGGEREAKIRDMESKIQELQASQAALIDALQKKEKEREERLQKEAKEKEVPKTEPADAFETAKAAFKAKKYDDAIDGLNKYLKFPKGKHGEEALFLRAESLYAKEQYKKAILDYSALQEKFPKSKNLPKALFKIGMSFEALGMKSDAKPFYQEVVEKHAKSPEAKLAKAKLK
ncbi:MAG: tetratricopeptide repeat protein [Bdellovibrionales bacterium]|nr:tetratricopeptide repeat protein [Bdellovibrionales bacterium]